MKIMKSSEGSEITIATTSDCVFTKIDEEFTKEISRRYFRNSVAFSIDEPNANGHNIEKLDAKIVHNCVRNQLKDIIASILDNYPTSHTNLHYDVYLGDAGVAYMFFHLSKCETCKYKTAEYLEKAKMYITSALANGDSGSSAETKPGLLLGNGGVYATAAVIYNRLGDEKLAQKYKTLYYEAANVCQDYRYLSYGSDDLYLGRSGFICGAVWMASELGTPTDKKILYQLCDLLVTSGRQNSQELARLSTDFPLLYTYFNVHYMGMAHGLAGPLTSLLMAPGYMAAYPSVEAEVRQCVNSIIELRDDIGNYPNRVDVPVKPHELSNDMIHWCHGAGGLIILMALAALQWPDDSKYINTCLQIGELIWERGLLKKGPSLCHGVAGNGYAFILLYRLTGDEKYVRRAWTFAKFLNSDEFRRESRVPDHPYSLFEGIAGTACFLADVLHPATGNFPYFNVFG